MHGLMNVHADACMCEACACECMPMRGCMLMHICVHAGFNEHACDASDASDANDANDAGHLELSN